MLTVSLFHRTFRITFMVEVLSLNYGQKRGIRSQGIICPTTTKWVAEKGPQFPYPKNRVWPFGLILFSSLAAHFQSHFSTWSVALPLRFQFLIPASTLPGLWLLNLFLPSSFPVPAFLPSPSFSLFLALFLPPLVKIIITSNFNFCTSSFHTPFNRPPTLGYPNQPGFPSWTWASEWCWKNISWLWLKVTSRLLPYPLLCIASHLLVMLSPIPTVATEILTAFLKLPTKPCPSHSADDFDLCYQVGSLYFHLESLCIHHHLHFFPSVSEEAMSFWHSGLISPPELCTTNPPTSSRFLLYHFLYLKVRPIYSASPSSLSLLSYPVNTVMYLLCQN